MFTTIISANELATQLSTVKLLDASWHMPTTGRKAKDEFTTGHIAGAQFFDIDEASNKASPYPHMLPSAEAFQAYVRGLGISSDDQIIVYDSVGLFSAARVWWMFRVFGHEKVAVLDGGLPAWKGAGKPLESGEAKEVKAGDFTAIYHSELVVVVDQLKQALTDKDIIVIDARSAPRFTGQEPEPRPNLPAGHIPDSQNIPYRSLLHPEAMTYKDVASLKEQLESAGVAKDKPVICTCGSGVTACILALALEITGHRNYAIYDGSWAEWGALPETPKSVG